MGFDVVSLTCRMKSILITAMFNIGTSGAIPVVPPKGTRGSGVTGIETISLLGSNEDAQCRLCNLQYIVETKRRFKDRFNEHRRPILNPTGNYIHTAVCDLS